MSKILMSQKLRVKMGMLPDEHELCIHCIFDKDCALQIQMLCLIDVCSCISKNDFLRYLSTENIFD